MHVVDDDVICVSPCYLNKMIIPTFLLFTQKINVPRNNNPSLHIFYELPRAFHPVHKICIKRAIVDLLQKNITDGDCVEDKQIERLPKKKQKNDLFFIYLLFYQIAFKSFHFAL